MVMGFFSRKNKEAKPPKSAMEKIVMGAIIGTAIGSVVGRSMAKKSGKETREYLREKLDAKKSALQEHQDDLEEITQLTKETVTGLGTLVKNLIFGKKGAKPKESRPHQDLKRIPEEEPVEKTSQD